MNDKSLVSFVTAAEKGSFYKAAQVLFTTPQTIVQQMNQLEQEVGMPLFERSNKGVRLTKAGRNGKEMPGRIRNSEGANTYCHSKQAPCPF